MDKITVLVNQKSKYFKTDKNLQRYINNGLRKIHTTIKQFEAEGVPFEKIFNCDALIYDKIKDYYTFKHRDSDNTQLRILYTYQKDNDGKYQLKLIHFKVKRNNDKEYIKFFTDYIENFTDNEENYKKIVI